MRERVVFAIGALVLVALVGIWTIRSAGDFLSVWFPVGTQLGVNPLMLIAEVAAVVALVVCVARAIR